MSMKTTDFNFDLPPELIAQTPSAVRGNDKLLHLERESGAVTHFSMADLPDLLPEGTLIVFNNSRVRRSRVYAKENQAAQKDTEFLFLNALDDTLSVWKVMVKNAKRYKVGQSFVFPDDLVGIIEENPAEVGTEFRTLSFSVSLSEAWFEKNGHIPLPPYIKRSDTQEDAERYQTVYASETGSVAAPTAGLHFTPELLEVLQKRGVDLAWVTLHVGLGTFLPVRTEHIENHHMHEEFFHVSKDTARKVARARAECRPILAVGTTTVRTLESAWDERMQALQTGTHSTSIFMYPGYRFKIVDMLFTNFHTPESTLLMLACAFAGTETLLSAYETAVQKKYRFFSYGDAMLIT